MCTEPTVTFQRADVEREVPHPKPWVTTFLHVGGRASPVLGEEQRQPVPGTGEIRLLGVQRDEYVVGAHPLVERVDESFEERHATDSEKGGGAVSSTAPTLGGFSAEARRGIASEDLWGP